MMTLYCFDVDGTLLTEEMEKEGQYVKGIIPTQRLIEIWETGNFVSIVSPSPFRPERFSASNFVFCRNGSNEYRWENVRDAQKFYEVSDEETIYVDDLEANRKQMESRNIQTYTPQEFMKIVFGTI